MYIEHSHCSVVGSSSSFGNHAFEGRQERKGWDCEKSWQISMTWWHHWSLLGTKRAGFEVQSFNKCDSVYFCIKNYHHHPPSKLSSIKKNTRLLSYTASEGQESWSCFPGWFWLKISHEAIGRLLTRTAVIWRSWGVHFTHSMVGRRLQFLTTKTSTQGYSRHSFPTTPQDRKRAPSTPLWPDFKVSHHDLCHSLLVTQTNGSKVWCAGVWIPGGYR